MAKVLIHFTRSPKATEVGPDDPSIEAGDIVSVDEASAERWYRRGAAVQAAKGAKPGKAQRPPEGAQGDDSAAGDAAQGDAG